MSKKKGPPRHQNTYKFKHNPNSKLTEKILSSPLEGNCEKCTRVLEWKKDYRKYKPLSVPRKCTLCQQKNITHAYHILCQKCASDNKLCARCKSPVENFVRDFNEKQIKEAEEREFEENFKKLSVRQQKKVLREKDKEENASKKKDRVEAEDGSEEDSDDEESAECNSDESANSEEEKEEMPKLQKMPPSQTNCNDAATSSGEEEETAEEPKEKSEDPSNDEIESDELSSGSQNEDEDSQLYCDIKLQKIDIDSLQVKSEIGPIRVIDIDSWKADTPQNVHVEMKSNDHIQLIPTTELLSGTGIKTFSFSKK